mgnify:CR=1 FL=1
MDAPEARAVFLLSGAVEIDGQFYEAAPGTGCGQCAFQVPGGKNCIRVQHFLRMTILKANPCFGVTGWQLKKNEKSSSS